MLKSKLLLYRKRGEMDMEKLDQQIDRPSKRLAILYSVFIAVPIYGILVGAYYLDFLNGFAFLGVLISCHGYYFNLTNYFPEK